MNLPKTREELTVWALENSHFKYYPGCTCYGVAWIQSCLGNDSILDVRENNEDEYTRHFNHLIDWMRDIITNFSETVVYMQEEETTYIYFAGVFITYINDSVVGWKESGLGELLKKHGRLVPFA